jgi:NADH-quinone oxidoreductase subunit L
MIVAFLTAFYMFRVVFLAFFGTPPAHSHGHETHPHDPPAAMALPLWILAALSMTVGIYFTFTHPETEFTNPGWLMPAAVGTAVAGILLAWLTYERQAINAGSLAAAFGPIRHAAIHRFWIDDLFEGIYNSVLLGFARIVGWLDRYIVDGVLNVVSAWTLTSGDDLRTLQTGRAQDYVYGVGVGLLILLLWARWALA